MAYMIPFNELNISTIDVEEPKTSEYTLDNGSKTSVTRTKIKTSVTKSGALKVEYPVVTCFHLIRKEAKGVWSDGKPKLEQLVVGVKFKYFDEDKNPEEQLAELNPKYEVLVDELISIKESGSTEEVEAVEQKVRDMNNEIEGVKSIRDFIQFKDELILRVAQATHKYAKSKYKIMNPITQKAYPAPVSRDSARPLVNDFIKFTNKNNDDEDADDVIDTSANPVQWIDLLHGYQSKEPDNFSVYGTKFGIPDPNNPGKVISINWEDLEGKEFDCIPVVNFTQTSSKADGKPTNIKSRMNSAIIIDIRDKASSSTFQQNTIAKITEKFGNKFNFNLKKSATALGIDTDSDTDTNKTVTNSTKKVEPVSENDQNSDQVSSSPQVSPKQSPLRTEVEMPESDLDDLGSLDDDDAADIPLPI